MTISPTLEYSRIEHARLEVRKLFDATSDAQSRRPRAKTSNWKTRLRKVGRAIRNIPIPFFNEPDDSLDDSPWRRKTPEEAEKKARTVLAGVEVLKRERDKLPQGVPLPNVLPAKKAPTRTKNHTVLYHLLEDQVPNDGTSCETCTKLCTLDTSGHQEPRRDTHDDWWEPPDPHRNSRRNFDATTSKINVNSQ